MFSYDVVCKKSASENVLYSIPSSDSEIDLEKYCKKCETHSSLKLSFRPVTSYAVECKELEQGFVDLKEDTPIMVPSGLEMCLVGSKDNEQRAKLGRSVRNKYIGHLVMQFPLLHYGKRVEFSGSACLVQHEGAFILLTSAHNMCYYRKDSGFIFPSKTTFYRGRYADEWLSRHQVKSFYPHPNWMEVFKLHGSDTVFDGVDIAICFLRWDEELQKLKSKWEMDDEFPRLWTPPEKSHEYDDKMKINVTGYPAEYEYCNHQYSMDGHANEILRSQTEEINGHILTYKDIDTTPGQSGSPVMSDNKIVGIHAGFCEKDKINVATFITSDMLTWIGSSVTNYMNQVKMVETKTGLGESTSARSTMLNTGCIMLFCLYSSGIHRADFHALASNAYIRVREHWPSKRDVAT